ncbi:MAG TPA: galactokinase [Armatimonadota bacterium]|jgi:galactokinase
MTTDRLNSIRKAFSDRFSGEPSFVVRAPGRVNIIGEHTDYNEGFVLPCALSFDVLLAVRPRADDTVALLSTNFSGETSFPVDDVEKSGPKWAHYIKGVAVAMREAGYSLRGMDAVVEGDVPLGSGLSSSAALEVAACAAFKRVAGLDIPGPEMAQICKRAENDFVGVASGIMDQFISAVGEAGHALFLDCRDLSYEQIPFDVESAGLRLVIADTAKRRSLTEGVYNQRVAECAEAVKLLSQFIPGIHSLRDVSFDQFQLHQPHLPEIIRKRARHVISENARVLGAVDALRAGSFEGLGALLNASHESLRNDYACTGHHLDAMVEESRQIPGVLGSRMTGAGFGGCTVSLVKESSLDQFLTTVPEKYTERTGLVPTLYVVTPQGGAGLV